MEHVGNAQAYRYGDEPGQARNHCARQGRKMPDDAQGSAERTAAQHAEQTWRYQRVTKYALVRRARDRQASAHQYRSNDSGQTHLDDQAVQQVVALGGDVAEAQHRCDERAEFVG